MSALGVGRQVMSDERVGFVDSFHAAVFFPRNWRVAQAFFFFFLLLEDLFVFVEDAVAPRDEVVAQGEDNLRW